MAKKTLNGEIAKQKKKSSFNAMRAETLVKENADLSKVIDFMADNEEYSQAFTANGFTKEEVKNAAKFALQAGAYDIEVTHLDVEDSPVYYKMGKNNKKKSRGRFTRKDLDEAGKALIARAREVQREQKEKLRQEISDILSASGTMDVGSDIDEQGASEIAEDRNMDSYESNKIVDDLADNTNYLNDMDTFFEGGILVKEDGKVRQDPAHKTFMNIVDSTLDKKIPSLSEFKRKLDDGIYETISGELMKLRSEGVKEEDIPARLKEAKKGEIKRADEKLSEYKWMYDAVRKGELAPEVLKLFLNSALMNNGTSSENELYERMLRPKNMKKPTPEEDKAYRQTLADLAIKSHSNTSHAIRVQYGGGIYEPEKWLIRGYKRRIVTAEQTHAKGDEALKTAISISNGFIHFRYVEEYKNGNVQANEKPSETKENVKRIYITCKPGKEKQMVEAWWKTMNANAGMDKLYFKLGAGPLYDRQEKIVIYIPTEKTVEDVMPYLNAFSDECAKNDILASEEESLITGKKIKPGIAFAKEPKLRILNKKISQGWWDKKEFVQLYKQCNPGVTEIRNNYAFSYNMYVNRAMILSVSIAKKKLNLKPGDKVADHKKELMPLVKKYFADFLKLAGSDPRTMDDPFVKA